MMRRMNTHLHGDGSPADIQRQADEVRDGITQALMAIHMHQLENDCSSAPVADACLRDAKDHLVHALIDLTALEAYNQAPAMLTGTLTELREFTKRLDGSETKPPSTPGVLS